MATAASAESSMPTINPTQGVTPYFAKRTVEEYAPIPKKIACPRLIWPDSPATTFQDWAMRAYNKMRIIRCWENDVVKMKG